VYILIERSLRRIALLAIMVKATSHIPACHPIKVEDSMSCVLTAVVRRLEAATSRLEDIASTSVGFDAAAPGQTTGAGTPAPSAQSDAVTPKAAESLPPSIQAFNKLLDNELKEWLELSAKLGDVINGQVRRTRRGLGTKV
jgi:adenylyl cyclase-associated protein